MNLSQSKKRVIVGMSGGVDSSLAAFLLKQQGYEVEGLFMRNWEDDCQDSNCSADQDLVDAQAVCMKLGIRLHTVNFSKEYWDHVFAHFLEEYKKGRTPNPDILCNQEIKFKAFLNYALELGADFIATGHYARVRKTDTGYELLKGIDPQKDQSYFLYAIGQKALSKTLFPIGSQTKTQTRQVAQDLGFRNYDKKGSTGICFIGERKFKTFLSQYLPAQPGNIETAEGKVVGKHDGLMYYTLGQRQGIGIGGLKNTPEAPWYVVAKDLKRNVLIIGQGHDHPLLFSSSLYADTLNWISSQAPVCPLKCSAKTRYRQMDQPCTIEKIENEVAHVRFDSPQRAVTPGQSVVFYQNEICLGGGIIS